MSDALTIRPAEPRDSARLDALFSRSYAKLLRPDYPPSTLVMVLPLITKAQPRLIASGSFYVAETDDAEIVGAGGWTRRGRPNHVGDIRHVVTDDRYLRRGIGRRLLDLSFQQAREMGVTLMDVMSTRTAVPFYQSMGFTVLGPIDVQLRKAISFPAIQMQRRI